MNIDFEITSIIERGKYLLSNYSNNSQFIFYAALEIRYVIEILLNDWLNFSIEGSHSLSEYLQEFYGDDIPEGSLDIPPNPKILNDKKRAKKYYSVKDYQNKILELVPKFEKRIEFMSLLDSHFDRMKAPDLSLLNEYYGKIGNLLHYPKFEIIKEKIYDDLISILSYLEQFDEPARCFLVLNADGEKMFNKFINNELSKDDLEYIKRNGNKYHSGGLYQL